MFFEFVWQTVQNTPLIFRCIFEHSSGKGREEKSGNKKGEETVDFSPQLLRLRGMASIKGDIRVDKPLLISHRNAFDRNYSGCGSGHARFAMHLPKVNTNRE